MDNEKLKEYIYGNIASIFWSIFLLIGGAIFVFYYAYIGYMPNFDFKSSVIILAAASITGIIIVLTLILILILPAAFWSNVWANSSSLKNNWEDKKENKVLLKTTLWFGTPILFFYVFFIILITNWIFFIPYLLIITPFLFFIIHKKPKSFKREIATMFCTSFICSILSFFPIYFVLSLSASDLARSNDYSVVKRIIVFVFIIFINALATAKPNRTNGPVYYTGLGMVAFFVVLLSFDFFYRVPERIMEIYKFGSIEAKKIIVKNETCNTLFHLGVLPKVESKQQCLINDVRILSRLGKDMYLEVNDITFTIKNSEVLSWSVQELPQKPSNSKQ